MVRPLIAGNWKMNGLKASLAEIEAINAQIDAHPDTVDCLICPPATLLRPMSDVAGARLKTGGQYCHAGEKGAHTGDVSAEMLADAGADYVIVGHSERRADHGESDSDVQAQAMAALRAGLTAIICCGESLDQRKAGETISVIQAQLTGSLPPVSADGPIFVVAYEPIWAIGTGEVATPEQIAEVHGEIRNFLKSGYAAAGAETLILYGGSMKPTNAAEILSVPDVNGGLIGGASLKADDFMAIYAVAASKD